MEQKRKTEFFYTLEPALKKQQEFREQGIETLIMSEDNLYKG